MLIRIPTRLGGGGFVEAEPKSEKARRSILLPTFVVDALKNHQQAQMGVRQKAGVAWKDHDYVFCTSHGTHLNPTHDMVKVLKDHLVKAGLPEIRFHDLRHSQATMLLGMKVHPKVVQEILGHSEIAVTMDIYSHVLPTMQEDAMQRINEVLQG